MTKIATELAAEVLAAAINAKCIAGDAETISKSYETIYKMILQCRQEEKKLKIATWD
jgi:hypothetical protein